MKIFRSLRGLVAGPLEGVARVVDDECSDYDSSEVHLVIDLVVVVHGARHSWALPTPVRLANAELPVPVPAPGAWGVGRGAWGVGRAAWAWRGSTVSTRRSVSSVQLARVGACEQDCQTFETV